MNRKGQEERKGTKDSLLLSLPNEHPLEGKEEQRKKGRRERGGKGEKEGRGSNICYSMDES